MEQVTYNTSVTQILARASVLITSTETLTASIFAMWSSPRERVVLPTDADIDVNPQLGEHVLSVAVRNDASDSSSSVNNRA